MLKRILLSIVLLLVIAYLVVAITAFNRKPAGQVCRDMELVIKDTVYAGFITKKEVSGMLEKKGIYPVGKPMDRIRSKTLERELAKHPLIDEVECYKTPSGILCVEVSQRIPILSGGGYELVAGERRLRAPRVAGLNDVPCLLIAADNEDSSAIALVENLQRRDLDFFEEAYGFKRLIDQYGLTQEEAARKVGKTQSAVANKLRLLRLSPQNMELIRSANLTERHARCLLRLHDDEERMNATHYIIENELNVSRSEEYIENLLEQKKHPELTEPPHKDNVVRLIKDVRFFLNTLNRAVGVMVDAGIGATVDRRPPLHQPPIERIGGKTHISRTTLSLCGSSVNCDLLVAPRNPWMYSSNRLTFNWFSIVWCVAFIHSPRHDMQTQQSSARAAL